MALTLFSAMLSPVVVLFSVLTQVPRSLLKKDDYATKGTIFAVVVVVAVVVVFVFSFFEVKEGCMVPCAKMFFS